MIVPEYKSKQTWKVKRTSVIFHSPLATIDMFSHFILHNETTYESFMLVFESKFVLRTNQEIKRNLLLMVMLIVKLLSFKI